MQQKGKRMPLTGKLKSVEEGGNVVFPTEMLFNMIAKSPKCKSEAATRWCRWHLQVSLLPRWAKASENEKQYLVNGRERDVVYFQYPRSISSSGV